MPSKRRGSEFKAKISDQNKCRDKFLLRHLYRFVKNPSNGEDSPYHSMIGWIPRIDSEDNVAGFLKFAPHNIKLNMLCAFMRVMGPYMKDESKGFIDLVSSKRTLDASFYYAATSYDTNQSSLISAASRLLKRLAKKWRASNPNAETEPMWMHRSNYNDVTDPNWSDIKDVTDEMEGICLEKNGAPKPKAKAHSTSGLLSIFCL